jgi:transposase
MIFNNNHTKVFLFKEPTDMRLGYNGLSALVKKAFKMDPYGGKYFAFVNKRRTSCKIFLWDGTGTVIISKRLHGACFARPNPSYKKQIKLSSNEFGQFFEGLNISGRILESVQNSHPYRKKRLRFIPPYKKLNPYDQNTARTNQGNQESK